MGYTELVGLALAAAGTGVGVASARKSQQAMNRKVVQEVEEQERYGREAKPIFDASLEASGPEKFKSVAGGEEARAKGMYESLSKFGVNNPLPVDNDRLKFQIAQARGAGARGQGYREGFTRFGLNNAEANRGLGVIANLSRSSAGNSGILTSLAGQEGADLAGIGSLMSTAGSLAAVYGATQARTLTAQAQQMPMVDKTKVA